MSAIPLHSATPIDAVRNDLEATLKLQRAAYLAHPYPSVAERKEDLRKLQRFIRENREAILDTVTAHAMKPSLQRSMA